MNSVKVAAVILVVIGLGSFYYLNTINNKKNIIRESRNYLIEKTSQELIDKNPLKWIKANQNNQTPSQISSEIKKIQDLVNSIQVPEQSEREDKRSIASVSGNNSSVNNISLVGDYYKNFLDALAKVNFTDEELAHLKKDTDTKRVLLLEELIEAVAGGENIDNLKTSFTAWHQLDEMALAELNKISVKPEANYLHQPMVDWFKYHSGLAKRFSEENLSTEQIAQFSGDFKNKAEEHNSRFAKSLAALKKSPDFVLIPKAEAFTCGALVPPPFYHFGGRVLDMSPCLGGIVEAISPPCGGLIFFSYPILAINPYLYKKPTIGSAVLGKSVVTPECCPISKEICTPYEATVLYFGTSLVP